MSKSQPSVLGRIASALAPRRGALDASWQPASGPYPRLIDFDVRTLAGRPGLYLIWHLGVRPQWLRVGYVNDLAAALTTLKEVPEIAAFAPNEGPYVSWRACAPVEAPRLVQYLASRLNPALQDLDIACDTSRALSATPLACPLPHGTKDVPPALDGHADRT